MFKICTSSILRSTISMGVSENIRIRIVDMHFFPFLFFPLVHFLSSLHFLLLQNVCLLDHFANNRFFLVSSIYAHSSDIVVAREKISRTSSDCTLFLTLSLSFVFTCVVFFLLFSLNTPVAWCKVRRILNLVSAPLF